MVGWLATRGETIYHERGSSESMGGVLHEMLARLRAGRSVGVFPEGFKGVGKGYRERYRLQRFGRGGFAEVALLTGAPIVPVAIVGAEEIYPLVGRAEGVGKLFGMPYVPFTPFFPLEGLIRLIDDWARDGLLLIGDAAHTMSPAGAIGRTRGRPRPARPSAGPAPRRPPGRPQDRCRRPPAVRAPHARLRSAARQ